MKKLVLKILRKLQKKIIRLHKMSIEGGQILPNDMMHLLAMIEVYTKDVENREDDVSQDKVTELIERLDDMDRLLGEYKAVYKELTSGASDVD